MEEWVAHEGCSASATTTIVGSWPLIKLLHEKFPTDCIFIDLQRVILLFDKNGFPIKERFDTDNTFWTKDNPLPVNSIENAEEVLELWRERKFQQTQDEVRWMMKIRDKYPETTILVIGQDVESLTCYMIQTFKDQSHTGKPKPVILTTVPNMKYNWFCRHCGKIFPSKQCPACAPVQNSKDTLAKSGTFYCNADCQKADWAHHKQTCKK